MSERERERKRERARERESKRERERARERESKRESARKKEREQERDRRGATPLCSHVYCCVFPCVLLCVFVCPRTHTKVYAHICLCTLGACTPLTQRHHAPTHTQVGLRTRCRRRTSTIFNLFRNSIEFKLFEMKQTKLNETNLTLRWACE